MKLDYVPLLQIQRQLQDIPRGMGRFRQYFRTISPDGANLKLPSLVAANPMAKDHVTVLLDALLARDADGVAALAVAEAAVQVADEPGDFRIALVIQDDLMGGWTNRYAEEFNWRFAVSPLPQAESHPPRWTKHHWVNGILWSSQAATEQAVREAVLTAIYRVAYVQRHGPARTLRAMLAQEGWVMARAGCAGPVLDEDDIAYTRDVLNEFLDEGDKRTVISCLFGDAAGRTLGFAPLGLSPWAGLALALHDARPLRPIELG